MCSCAFRHVLLSVLHDAKCRSGSALCKHRHHSYLHIGLPVGTRTHSLLHWFRFVRWRGNYFRCGFFSCLSSILAELLEDAPRPIAMSMGSLCSWTGNFLIGMCFPLLKTYWSSFAFMPCFLVCVGCFLLVWRYLPETRGRQPQDVKPYMADGLRSKRK